MKRSLPAARLRGRATCRWISELSMACGLLSVVVVGCAGSLDPGVTGGGGAGGSGGPAADCQVAIFESCAGCHAAGTGSAGLDLASANPETRLVGKMTSTVNGGMCGNMTLINPNVNPATGVFIDKITMNPPPCGMSMPYGSLPNAADTACLKAWAAGVASMPAAFTGEATP